MTNTGRPLRAFLCHASDDKAAVQRLYARLVADGVDAWLDQEKLIPGQNWRDEITKAVRESDIVIVCLSQRSVTKEGFVQKEIKFALDIADEKLEGSIFIVPVRLEVCEVPKQLSSMHWVDLFSSNGYERIVKALQVRANGIGATAPVPLSNDHPPSNKSNDPGRDNLHSTQIDLGPPATALASNRFIIKEPIHLELIRIPEGEFLMGSDPQKDMLAQPGEQPQRRVYLPEFYISKYPITNLQYATFIKMTNHPAPRYWTKGEIPAAKGKHPVTNILSSDCFDFCRWLSEVTGKPFRLPKEAEWEKTARGTDGRIYPWGDEWDLSRANVASKAVDTNIFSSWARHFVGTTSVYEHSPNGDSPYGVADMSGNAWELCDDLFFPQTSESEGIYVVRGGVFYESNKSARCASRHYDHHYGFPGFPLRAIGFRAVISHL